MMDMRGAVLEDVGPGSYIHGWVVAGEHRRSCIMWESLTSFVSAEADVITVERAGRRVEVAISRRFTSAERLNLLISAILTFNDQLEEARKPRYVH